jgi:hypothetical protein
MKYLLFIILLNVTLETLKFDKFNDIDNDYKINNYSKVITIQTLNLKHSQFYKIMVHYIASVYK